MSNRALRALASVVAGAALLLAASGAFAQVTPAAGYTPPDDAATVKVGGVIYTSYSYQDTPKAKDADGNDIHTNLFEVSRAYINVTGNITHLVSYRVTPDIAGRLATTVSKGATGETASTNYDGNLVFRLKYAFGQLNLDDWLTHGSWVRIGQQQTPYLDFIEGIYRYRFQGTTYVEREGFVTSSDVGLSAHFALPNDYGDIHAGFYNGDGYTKAEANDQKAFQVRGTLRPLARTPLWKGLRLTAFYDADHYIKNGSRNRFIGSTTFEHPHLNLGFDYFNAKDQTSGKPGTAAVEADGWSVWVNPRASNGLEAFLRFDNAKPNKTVDAHRKRTIAGVSYWFKTTAKGVSAVAFANLEKVDYDTLLDRPNEKRFNLSCQFGF